MKTIRMFETICIVDDDPAILKALSDILEEKGYRVTLAKTGMEALNVIQAEPPAVVLLDVWLPELDGLEVLKRVRKQFLREQFLGDQFPNVVVIMMCGRGSVETAVKAMKMGAYDCLEKPLYLEKVHILVRNAIRESRYRYLMMKRCQYRQECSRKSCRYLHEGEIYFFLLAIEEFAREALNQSSDRSEWGDNPSDRSEWGDNDNFFGKNLERLKRFSFGKKSWEGKYGVGIAPDKDKVIIGVWRECDAEKNTRAPKVQPEGHLKNKLDETIGPGKDNDWLEWSHPFPLPPYWNWGTQDRWDGSFEFPSENQEAVEHIGGQLVSIIKVAAPIIDEHVRRTS